MADLSRAFEGIKVCDFSWIGAGPAVTKCLADHGATVVRMENATKPDTLRISGPFKDGRPGVDRSGYYAVFNTNKYSMSLNLKSAKGRELARRLVAWADVAVENFTAGTLERMGFSFEAMLKLNPDIILLRSSTQGQFGPHSNHPGYGTLLTSLSGFSSVTGWPDRGPAQPHGAHTDLCGARIGTVALLATMVWWLRTGKGQCLDVSQLEAGLHFLSPMFLDSQCSGNFLSRQGNHSPQASPHAVFRCLGDDRWCAIAVFEESQWAALRAAMGKPSWAEEPRFATLADRKQHEEELDGLVEEWTSGLTAEDAMARLQAAGVPAGVVQSPQNVLSDPQLRHRSFFWPMDHAGLGHVSYQGQPFDLSRTPAEPRMPSPCLGEHTEQVCREILGLSDEEFMEYLEAGAFD